MTTFSRRHGYASDEPPEYLLEDAPSWLRLAYESHVLREFLKTRSDRERPISDYGLSQEICIHFHRDASDVDESWYTSNFIQSCEWYEFYDLVEIVGMQIRAAEDQAPSWQREEHLSRYGFQVYCKQLNELFTKHKVGWRLGDDGLLKREMPTALESRIDVIQQELADAFDPAREHYKKAVRFATQRPFDPENSIKEVISAVESVGRVKYPKAKTLGDVVKEIRKIGALPNNLTNVIEKFYAYASDEPAVRHGSPVSSRVLLDDAEFCLHVGAALIRYLIAHSRRQ